MNHTVNVPGRNFCFENIVEALGLGFMMFMLLLFLGFADSKADYPSKVSNYLWKAVKEPGPSFLSIRSGLLTSAAKQAAPTDQVTKSVTNSLSSLRLKEIINLQNVGVGVYTIDNSWSFGDKRIAVIQRIQLGIWDPRKHAQGYSFLDGTWTLCDITGNSLVGRDYGKENDPFTGFVVIEGSDGHRTIRTYIPSREQK